MDSTASSALGQGQSRGVASEPGSRTSCLTKPCGETDGAFRTSSPECQDPRAQPLGPWGRVGTEDGRSLDLRS